MTFKDKIDKILSDNKLQIESVSGLEDFLKAGRGAINDFYNRDEEPGRKTLKRILSLPRLNQEWWATGKGPVFIAGSDEKHTPVQKGTDNTGKPLRAQEMLKVLQDALAEGSDYRIIPRTIIENQAKELDLRLRELDEAKRLKDEVLDAKNKLIAHLEKEIEGLRAKPVAAQGTQ